MPLFDKNRKLLNNTYKIVVFSEINGIIILCEKAFNLCWRMKKMNKKRNIIIILLFLCVFGIMEIPKEYAYLISGKTMAIIYSEGYYEKVVRIGSKNRHYLYQVQYAVNGKNYISDAFETEIGTYKKGDTIEVRYNQDNPQELVRTRVPFSWFIFIIGIVIIIQLMVEKVQ